MMEVNLRDNHLNTHCSHEMPSGVLGGSWGGGFIELTEDNDITMANLLNWVKNEVKFPHSDTESPFTTTLKLENCWIEISKEAKEFLTKRGFNWVKYKEELGKITQREATQEDLMKAKTFDLMEKQMDKLKDECWAIRGYIENELFKKRNSSSYYSEKMIKFGLDTKDLNKLKELYDLKANQYHIYYCKVYEMRWDKPCDDEYSYP
jgi:hypothetical protein